MAHHNTNETFPKHQMYKTYSDRMKSYEGWPKRYVPKTPEDLASAGFFYIGSADRVTCYYCGITLRDWEIHHDPATEHKRYSEHCQFISKSEKNVTVSQTNYYSIGASTIALVSNVNSVRRDLDTETEESVVGQMNKLNGVDRTSQEASDDSSSEWPLSDTKDAGEPKHVFGKLAKLLEENKRLKQERTCKMCKVKEVAILFLPCGHLVTCSNCSDNVKDCLECQKAILGTVRIYVA